MVRLKLKTVYTIITCVLLLLFVSGLSLAAPTAGGELRTLFKITPDDSGFEFDGLTLDFNAGLTARDGVQGEFNYDGRQVDTLAYYYIEDVFSGNDQFNIGRFSIDWASEKSLTMNGSLAEQVQDDLDGVAWPRDRDLGFDKGIGVKYKTAFPQFALVTSVSNRDFNQGTDFVGRGSFQVNPDLRIGAGLASVNRDPDMSNFAVLIDAGFDAGPVDLLLEVVSVNSEYGEEKETNSGFYAEVSYAASPRFTVYGSFYGAEELINEMVAAGFLTKLTPYATLQGEIQNTRDDWNLGVGLQVNF